MLTAMLEEVKGKAVSICVACLTKIKGNFITKMKNIKRMDKGRMLSHPHKLWDSASNWREEVSLG